MSEQERFRRQLSAYLDGELGQADAKRLEKALEADEELAAELEALRRLREMLRTLPRERAPSDFVTRVMEQAEKAHLVGRPAERTSPGALRWVRYLATAAVLLVALAVGTVVVRTLSTESIEDLAGRTAPEEECVRGVGPESSLRSIVAGGHTRPSDTERLEELPEVDRKEEIARNTLGAGTNGSGASRRTLPANAINEVIDTPDLLAARKQVETVLLSNCIVPAGDTRPHRLGLAKAAATPSSVYLVRKDTPEQVQYLAFVPRSRLGQLQKDLDSLRRRQFSLPEEMSAVPAMAFSKTARVASPEGSSLRSAAKPPPEEASVSSISARKRAVPGIWAEYPLAEVGKPLPASQPTHAGSKTREGSVSEAAAPVQKAGSVGRRLKGESGLAFEKESPVGYAGTLATAPASLTREVPQAASMGDRDRELELSQRSSLATQPVGQMAKLEEIHDLQAVLITLNASSERSVIPSTGVILRRPLVMPESPKELPPTSAPSAER